MARFELNQAGMRKVEREIQRSMQGAEKRVNEALRKSEGKSLSEKEAAVTRALKASGVEPNQRAVREMLKKNEQ